MTKPGNDTRHDDALRALYSQTWGKRTRKEGEVSEHLPLWPDDHESCHTSCEGEHLITETAARCPSIPG